MNRLGLLVGLAWSLSLAAQAQGPAILRSGDAARALQQMEREAAGREFAGAGFRPLTRLEKGEEVRRLVYTDAIVLFPTRGVQIRRDRRGQASLQVVGEAGPGPSAPLSKADWARLAALDEAVFAPPVVTLGPPPQPGAPPSPPPPICHGELVHFAAAGSRGERYVHWAACGETNKERLAYAIEAARLAVSTRPACSFDQANPFWSFSRCFNPQVFDRPAPPPNG